MKETKAPPRVLWVEQIHEESNTGYIFPEGTDEGLLGAANLVSGRPIVKMTELSAVKALEAKLAECVAALNDALVLMAVPEYSQNEEHYAEEKRLRQIHSKLASEVLAEVKK